MKNRNFNRRPKPHKLNRRQKKTIFLLACATTAVLLCILSVILFTMVLSRQETEEQSAIIEAEEIPPQNDDETRDVSENDSEKEPPVSYPEPDYNFTMEELYVPLEGLTKDYTIAWVSDLHLITDHKPGGISDGSMIEVNRRYNTLSVTKDGVHAEELWPEIVKCLNAGNYDAVIFGGDMMDYCSVSNMEVLKNGYEQLRYDKDRILYIRSDHDYGAWYVGMNFTQFDIYDLHKELDGDELTEKYLDMGEFMMIGINDSTKSISEENYTIVKSLYDKADKEKKPVIAVTHVPYGSNMDPTLEQLSIKIRNKPYYWCGPDYQPSETMWDYLDFIFGEEPRAKMALAGHLHAAWDGMVTEKLREHIFSPAFSGTIGVIHVVPEDADVDTSTYFSRKYYPEEAEEKVKN